MRLRALGRTQSHVGKPEAARLWPSASLICFKLRAQQNSGPHGPPAGAGSVSKRLQLGGPRPPVCATATCPHGSRRHRFGTESRSDPCQIDPSDTGPRGRTHAPAVSPTRHAHAQCRKPRRAGRQRQAAAAGSRQSELRRSRRPLTRTDLASSRPRGKLRQAAAGSRQPKLRPSRPSRRPRTDLASSRPRGKLRRRQPQAAAGSRQPKLRPSRPSRRPRTDLASSRPGRVRATQRPRRGPPAPTMRSRGCIRPDGPGAAYPNRVICAQGLGTTRLRARDLGSIRCTRPGFGPTFGRIRFDRTLPCVFFQAEAPAVPCTHTLQFSARRWLRERAAACLPQPSSQSPPFAQRRHPFPFCTIRPSRSGPPAGRPVAGRGLCGRDQACQAT